MDTKSTPPVTGLTEQRTVPAGRGRVQVQMDPETNAERKWGEEVIKSGYQMIPDVLVRCQKFLGLEAMDVLILLNITMHWWNYDNLPHPRPSAIANRMSVSTRTVERRIARMQKSGLIVRMPSEDKDGKTVRRYDLSRLVRKLKKFATRYNEDFRGPWWEGPTA